MARINLTILALPLAQAAQKQEPADLTFTNRGVYAANDLQPWAEAVAVKGNKVVHGSEMEVVERFTGEDTKRFDLASRIIIPGRLRQGSL